MPERRSWQRLGPEPAASYDFGALRLVASGDEQLGAEAVRWVQEVFGVPVLDTWGQTETGGTG